MKFLVVDDNRLMNRFLCTYLRGKGHEAHSLTDPAQVKRWVETNSPDAVILDIAMPKIDGITLLGTLRGEFADMTIVMFTGIGYDEETMAACRKAGSNGYVSKGLGPSEIYSAIMRALAFKTT